MQLFVFLLYANVLLGIFWLIYIPIKFVMMRDKGQSGWFWLTRKKIIWIALSYLLGALFLWLLSMLIAIGNPSGGANVSRMPFLENFLLGWSIVYLSFGVVAIVIIIDYVPQVAPENKNSELLSLDARKEI